MFRKTLIARCLTLLILALLSTNLAWGKEVTKTYTLSTSDNGKTVTTDDVNWEVGSNAIEASSSNMKLTGTITVTLPTGATLNKVEITKSNNWGSGATVVFASGTTTLNTFISNGTFSLTSKKTDGVYTFTKGGPSNKNAWVKEIKVTYEEAAAAVNAPTFSVAAGNYTEAQTVELSCATEGAFIYYTTDGSEPTATSTQYTSAIAVNKSMTIKAIAIKGDDKSTVATAAYKITTYASLEDLVADGDPGKDGYSVTVTLTNEVITDFYTSSSDSKHHGVYLKVGEKTIEIYCNANAVPEEWIEGGTVSGTLQNCTWQNYNGTWELCPENWNALTYNAPTTYNITIADGIQNGTVEADMEKAAAGVEVTLTVTPDEGYKLGILTVKDATEADVPVEDNKFTMPASDVNVSATFVEKTQYTVTYMSLGTQVGTEQVYDGDLCANVPTVGNIPTGWTFLGWTTGSADNTTTAPEPFDLTTPITSATTLNAVFTKTEGEATWDETELAELTSSDVFVMVGSNEKFLQNNSTTAVEAKIENEKISTEIKDEYKWNVTKNDNSYVFNANGSTNVLYFTSANNGVKFGTPQSSSESTKYFTQNDKGYLVGTDGTNTRYLSYYASNNDWRCYANTSNNPIAMKFYKLNAGTTYYTTVAPATEYAITIDGSIEHGTVEIEGGISSAIGGTEITLVVTPKQHYSLKANSLTVTGESSATVKLTPVTGEEGKYTFEMPAEAVTITAQFIEDAKYTVSFSVNGEVTTSDAKYAGELVEFPTVSPIAGYTFMGWTTDPINGKQNDAPVYVENVTQPADNDVLYFAVFAKETSDVKEMTSKMDFSEETYSDWTVDESISRTADQGTGGTGDFAGKINTNNTYITFKDKVKVCSFEFSFKRTSDNSNYNVYIETSTDKENWTAHQTYPMSDFNNGSYTTKTDDTFDGETDLYVRFHCNNTTAVRYVDDVIIKYMGEDITYSNYCTSVPRTFTKTISDRKMATLYLDYAVTIPEDVKAYTATDKGDHTAITLEKITDGVIPANTGVIVYADVETNTSFDFVETATTKTYDNNCLKGVTEKTAFDAVADYDATNYNYYALMAEGTSVVFKLVSAGSYAANSAYLVLPKTANAKVDFTFDDEPTGITSYENENDNENLKAMTVYNLNGMRVNGSYKGIVIMNGKKYINK